jgi:hypothetical protein
MATARRRFVMGILRRARVDRKGGHTTSHGAANTWRGSNRFAARTGNRSSSCGSGTPGTHPRHPAAG